MKDSRFGIVVVTAENENSPWLNFEAGALSKVVGGDTEQRVVPLLVDISSPTQLDGPLRQFQGVTAQREGVKDLVTSLAAVAGIEARVAASRFDVFWPSLEEKIGAAKASQSPKTGRPKKRDEAEIFDEMLLHLRAIRSESEARSAKSTGPSGRSKAPGFHLFLDELAERHNLEIFEYPNVHNAAGRTVTVVPTGDFSSDDVEAFEADLRVEAAPRDRNVEVSWVPF